MIFFQFAFLKIKPYHKLYLFFPERVKCSDEEHNDMFNYHEHRKADILSVKQRISPCYAWTVEVSEQEEPSPVAAEACEQLGDAVADEHNADRKSDRTRTGRDLFY